MQLLIDVGNTRAKWATHDVAGLGQQQAAPHAEWTVDDVLEQVLAPLPRAKQVLVSNVAGPRVAALIIEACAQAWGVQPRFVQATAAAAGVSNAYVEPAKLGVDRWLGIIAAHHLRSGAVCVASVGTAMTIDAVDAAGRHLGGLITPGPDLMQRSLFGATSDIAARVGESLATATFATDTAAAVRQGARHALAALIVRCTEWTRQATGQEPHVLLTGGGSGQIEPLLTLSYITMPDLVLQGLAILADVD